MGFKSKRARLIINIIICLIFVVLVSGKIAYAIYDSNPPVSDAAHYVTMGYNLANYGVVSLETGDIQEPEPTALREPVYPAYLALVIKVLPGLRSMDHVQIFESGYFLLKYAQIPILLILSFLVMYFVYRVTRSILFSYFALFLVGFSVSLERATKNLLTETLAAIFVILVSLVLYLIITNKNKRIYYFLLLGCTLGLLVLTRAIYKYLIFFVVIVLIVVLFKTLKLNKKKFITGVFLFLISYALIVGGWTARNYMKLGKPFISGRGGFVLLVRAQANTMEWNEFASSFLYWTPNPNFKYVLLNKLFDKDDYIYVKANRFYNEAADILKEVYTHTDDRVVADEGMRNIALDKIKKAPFRHILATTQFAWRGIFVESWYSARLPGFEFLKDNMAFVNLFLFFSLFYIMGLSIKNKKWGIFMILVPSLYLYALNSFLSHNIPRYSEPMLPVLYISAVLLIYHWTGRKRDDFTPVFYREDEKNK